MKLLQPELFNSKIRPYANDIYANTKDDGSAIVEVSIAIVIWKTPHLIEKIRYILEHLQRYSLH